MKAPNGLLKRSVLLLMLTLLLSAATLIFTSCQPTVPPEVEKIVDVQLQNVPSELVVDSLDSGMKNIEKAFNDCQIEAIVTYSDGSYVIEPITFDQLDVVVQQTLNTEGRHYASLVFKGIHCDLQVQVKLAKRFTVTFYNALGDVISQQSVKKGDAAVEPTEAERNVAGYEFVSWDKSFDKITRDLDVYGVYNQKLTVNFYNGNGDLIDTQYLTAGQDATEPDASLTFMPGYKFYAWSTSLKNIQADTNIYGFYISDPITDTDGDGLTDYMEVVILAYDYRLVDTDGNGVNDGNEDYDNDGISNLDEIRSYLKPEDPDTDDDGLTDGEELMIYWTIPDDPDTDCDGASDGWEVQNGFDPLDYNDSFPVFVAPTVVTPGVDIPGLEGDPESIKIEPTQDPSLQNIKGAVIEAHDFTVDGTFDSAVISFKVPDNQQGEDLAIMYFNEEKQCLELLNTTISNGVASAETSHFSTYTLINRSVFEKGLKFYDTWMVDPDAPTSGYSNLEIVFVIDRSGSMNSNDKNYDRLEAAKQLLAKVPQGAKIGVIAFDSQNSIECITGSFLTQDKVAVEEIFKNKSYFSPRGGTCMYHAIQKGISLFESNDTSAMKIMVVLSDGQTDYTNMRDDTIAMAKQNNVNISTVALGISSTSTYYKDHLKRLADETGGDDFFASSNNYDELTDRFEKIGMGINLFMDSDQDDVYDYYESMGKYQNADNKFEITDLQGVHIFDQMFSKLWADTEDMDGDGLTNGVADNDTDGDGYLDGEEVKIYTYFVGDQVSILFQYVSDPTDASSVPAK